MPQMSPAPHAAGHVLIIEDEQDLRETTAELLDLAGYRVDCAANGEEALTHLRKGPLPRLILLDLMMPVMNGWQFRQQQLRDPVLAPIPVVVVSALGSFDSYAPMLDSAKYLVKPVAVDELLTTVARYLSP
jgi:CheY-like chemotaxis protein